MVFLGMLRMGRGRAPHVRPRHTASGRVLRLAEPLEPRLLLATFTVTNVENVGDGSLRKAIADANSAPGPDVINFAIPGNGPHVIRVAPAVPNDPFSAPMPINDAVVIDGYSQPGASRNTLAVGNNASIRIQLDGQSAGAGVVGVFLNAASNVVISGLSVTRFEDGVVVRGGGNNLIAGNFVGLDPAGNPAGNRGYGVSLEGSGVNRVGGIGPDGRNVISANGRQGVRLVGAASVDNSIRNNYVGTDPSGSLDRGNGGNGIEIGAFEVAQGYASRTVIGGTDPAARNVVSGNGLSGVALIGTPARQNVIKGNYIGIDAAGAAAVPNDRFGILMTLPVSGSGVALSGSSSDNTIGGDEPGAGNIISGNRRAGVFLVGTANNNVIQGNLIGTSAAGVANVGNVEQGILLRDAADINVAGPTGNLIGGTTAGAANTVSGNDGDGVEVSGARTGRNVFQRNRIGAALDGSPLGNGRHGVFVNNTSGQVIGHDGVAPDVAASSNLIAHNRADGVSVAAGTRNRISGNLFFRNGDLALDLGDSGQTPNDPGDADAGANNLLNSPGIQASQPLSPGLRVRGEYSGGPSQTLRVEYYRNPRAGGEPVYLGTRSVFTDFDGRGAIDESFPSAEFEEGDTVSALAVDGEGNSSELSTGNVLEILARQIAYARVGQAVWVDRSNMPVTYRDMDLGYTVDRVFADPDTGFYALGLQSAAHGPALVFRGTETESRPGMVMDLFADSDPRGVGYDQFSANWRRVSAWLDAQKAAGKAVDFTGHSLGGALVQWFAAAWTSLSPGTGVLIDDIATFNAAGITNALPPSFPPLITYASRFDPSRADDVTHYVVNGDIVSMAGQAFIAGRVDMATYPTLNLLHKHVLPLLTPRIGNTDRPADLQWRSYATADALSHPAYGHDDADYRRIVLGLQLAANHAAVAVPALIHLCNIPPLMLERGKTEAARQAIGSFVREFIDALEWTRETASKVRLTFRERSRDLLELTALTFDSDFDLRVEPGPGGLPSLRFEGSLGLDVGRHVSVNLPDWLGGSIQSDHLLSLANPDVRGVIDSRGLRVSGRLSVLGGLMVTEGSADFDWRAVALKVTGSSNILNGFVTASSGLSVSSRLAMAMGGTGSVHIPDASPFLGGVTLASGNFRLSFVNNANFGDDFVEVWGNVGVVRLGLRVGFDGAWAVVGGQSLAPVPAGPGLAMVAGGQAGGQAFRVNAGTDWAMLTAEWENGSPAAELRLTTPDGRILTEAEILSDPSLQIVPELTAPRRRAVLITDPAAGEWSVAVADPTGLGAVRYEALAGAPPVAVAFTNVSGGAQGQPVNVRLDLSGAADGARVALFYDTDASGQDGVLIASGLDGAGNTVNYTWQPEDLPSGDYFLYAAVTHPSGLPVVSYAPVTVRVDALPPAAAVLGRHVFYNASGFDGGDAAATAADDVAIARNKQALLQGQTPSSLNVTNYVRGVNGVMVDVAALPPGGSLSADDFVLEAGDGRGTWTVLAVSPTVSVRRGAGTMGADRVTLTLPDGAARNAWLRVTVKATANTGLTVPDTFRFGNLAGETGDAGGTPRVTALDFLRTRRAMFADASVNSPFDFNRDGRVSPLDLAVVRAAMTGRRSLALTNPPAAPPPPASSAPPPRMLLADGDPPYGLFE